MVQITSPVKAQKMKKTSIVVKAQILMSVALIFLIYEGAIQHLHLDSYVYSSGSASSSSVAKSPLREETRDLKHPIGEEKPSHQVLTSDEPQKPVKDFDCAVNWLRMPKTASTSVVRTFIGPLYQAGRFTNTETDPNACITGVGQCAPFSRKWRLKQEQEKKGGQKVTRREARLATNGISALQSIQPVELGPPIPAPPYGVSNNGSVGDNFKIAEKIKSEENSNSTSNEHQRCFPVPGGPTLHCYEYDARTYTLNFGPHRRNPKMIQQMQKKRKNPDHVVKHYPSPPSIQQAYYDYHPTLKTHVGLDPSLFGWILPPNPMVFSTFRDPVERLLSSFHYGIQFGGGRPGEVTRCDLPGVKDLDAWQKRVVKAREIATVDNDTTVYQDALREYLTTCRNAADNAYVQFLDPNTKDVNMALENLEKYVIVGLQTDVDGSLRRWANITFRSCRDHPQIRAIKSRINQQLDAGEVRWRVSESQVESETDDGGLDGDENGVDVGETKDSGQSSSSKLSLVTPDVKTFEQDLQDLIREYTVGDEVIFKRVVEMYEEQRHWGEPLPRKEISGE